MDELESVCQLVKKIHDATDALANMELKELNLTLSQSRTLYFLYRSKGQSISVKAIETQFCIRHATAIGIVNRLEHKGFVKSCGSSGDKRVRLLEITGEGEKIVEAMTPKFSLLEEKSLQALAPEDVISLKKMLMAIHANLQRLR